MDAVDTYIPTPERAVDKPFLMADRGRVRDQGPRHGATGRIERGIVKVGDEVEIVGVKPTRKAVVTGVEMFNKTARPGPGRRQRRAAAARHRARGDRARPGAGQARLDHAAHQVQAEVYVLTKEEGGRHTPFFSGYRPQFYFRTTDVTGAIGLPDGAEMGMPGDNVEMTVELITPIAMDDGLRFAIREGGRTVGAGAVVDDRSSRDEMARVESASDDPARLHRVQAADVHDAQEQEERSEPDRAEQILPARAAAYTSPRGEVGRRRAAAGV